MPTILDAHPVPDVAERTRRPMSSSEDRHAVIHDVGVTACDIAGPDKGVTHVPFEVVR